MRRTASCMTPPRSALLFGISFFTWSTATTPVYASHTSFQPVSTAVSTHAAHCHRRVRAARVPRTSTPRAQTGTSPGVQTHTSDRSAYLHMHISNKGQTGDLIEFGRRVPASRQAFCAFGRRAADRPRKADAGAGAVRPPRAESTTRLNCSCNCVRGVCYPWTRGSYRPHTLSARVLLHK
jgi:hypothetical protein